jgi:GDP-L-fucose synthase
MQHYDEPGHINIGAGEDITILALAKMIAEIAGFKGRILLDTTRPDGTPRKLLDISKIRDLGWQPTISLSAGVQKVFHEYCQKWPIALPMA